MNSQGIRPKLSTIPALKLFKNKLNKFFNAKSRINRYSKVLITRYLSESWPFDQSVLIR